MILNNLDDHRKQISNKHEILNIEPPFSFFDLIEECYDECDSIRRLFSLSRTFDSKTLIIEEIYECGIITEENEDILKVYPTFKNIAIQRISFWRKETISNDKVSKLTSRDLIGYAILKHDVVPEKEYKGWHIFESVFINNIYEHNCVPLPKSYSLNIINKTFEIKGLLYCQQNGFNKTCAQVAIRSLLSRILLEGDISYRRINQLATADKSFKPENGLKPKQIRRILKKLKIGFSDIDYTIEDSKRKTLPYQKYAYAGIESGYGALVGFKLSGIDDTQDRHIIPFYGHTFDKDTWVPDAEFSYFKIGEDIGYIPSENWTSSFIGHDDNFGPNYCIPRLYIEKDNVDYVVELYRFNCCYNGMQAEASALNILYSVLNNIDTSKNKWLNRLCKWTQKQRIIFRALSVSSSEYIAHLRVLKDYDNNTENQKLCDSFAEYLSKIIWMVEISTPQLFPANKRKLGEIVLDATQKINVNEEFNNFKTFLFARFPSIYLISDKIINENYHFTLINSEIKSHTKLIEL